MRVFDGFLWGIVSFVRGKFVTQLKYVAYRNMQSELIALVISSCDCNLSNKILFTIVAQRNEYGEERITSGAGFGRSVRTMCSCLCMCSFQYCRLFTYVRIHR